MSSVVYVLIKDRKSYIGFTNNLKRRVEEHKKESSSCKLVYYEVYMSESLARKRERKLKHYGSAWSGLKKRLDI